MPLNYFQSYRGKRIFGKARDNDKTFREFLTLCWNFRHLSFHVLFSIDRSNNNNEITNIANKLQEKVNIHHFNLLSILWYWKYLIRLVHVKQCPKAHPCKATWNRWKCPQILRHNRPYIFITKHSCPIFTAQCLDGANMRFKFLPQLLHLMKTYMNSNFVKLIYKNMSVSSLMIRCTVGKEHTWSMGPSGPPHCPFEQ